MKKEFVRLDDLRDDQLRLVIEALLDRLGLEIYLETTPDYESVELRERQ